MKEKLFNELKETNWFDCDEDIYDFISEVMPFLEKGKVADAVECAMNWIESIYNNLHKGIAFNNEETKKFLRGLFSFAYEFENMDIENNDFASKEQILYLLNNYNVNKSDVMNNLFYEEEIDNMIAERMEKENWKFDDVEKFFEINCY